jgi:hypothetical protein
MQELISPIIAFFSVPSTGGSDAILSLNTLLKWGVFYLFIIWLACVIWVIKDITNRSDSFVLQVISILLVTGLTPIFGLPIYLLIRPSTTLFERYYEETSLLALEENEEKQVHTPPHPQIETKHCHACNGSISAQDSFCPHCGIGLLESCVNCWARLQADWKYCNSCWQKRVIPDWILGEMGEPSMQVAVKQ